jgi:hypothetical protein
MLRRRISRAVLAVAGALGLMATVPATSASASPTSLIVSQSTAFTVLGHSCGGIRQNDFGSQFDPSSGYPDGYAYVWTTCSTGGRGGGSHTYSAWLATTWDFTGALVSHSTLAAAPSVNPTLSVFDSHGNQLYNQSNRAYLVLAAGFVPAPRVAGVSPSSAPQGTTLAISGTGFTGATAVNFGSIPAASFIVTSDTSITAVAPGVRKGSVDVTVIGPGGTSAINTGDRFTFTRTPRVASLSPTSGSADGGTVVTISGVNFNHAQFVGFGGIPAQFTVLSDTAIRAISPSVSDPVVVDVSVTNKHGTSTIGPGDRFTYGN